MVTSPMSVAKCSRALSCGRGSGGALRTAAPTAGGGARALLPGYRDEWRLSLQLQRELPNRTGPKQCPNAPPQFPAPPTPLAPPGTLATQRASS